MPQVSARKQNMMLSLGGRPCFSFDFVEIFGCLVCSGTATSSWCQKGKQLKTGTQEGGGGDCVKLKIEPWLAVGTSCPVLQPREKMEGKWEKEMPALVIYFSANSASLVIEQKL